MSVAVSQPVVEIAHEPFGQTGVRQYFGSFLAFLFAVGFAVALSMWVRSLSVADIFDVYYESGRSRVASSYGRLVVWQAAGRGDPVTNWSYSTRVLRPMRGDPWEAGFWKSVGIEFGRESDGWWIRAKWPVVGLLMAVWPTMHVLLQVRRSAKARAELDSRQVYCRRCGRPTATDAQRCAVCGRPRPAAKVFDPLTEVAITAGGSGVAAPAEAAKPPSA